MKESQKVYRIVFLMLFVLATVGTAVAQDRVLIPSTATGGFGETNACHTAMVPAFTLAGPQTVVINAAGRIKFGNPSYEVPPAGISIGANRSLGTLVGVFVEKARASDPAFRPVNEALTGWGIPSSGLFLIGNGPYRFEAPGAGTLYLGISAGDVCGTSGSFSVSVTVPVKIAGLAGGSLTIHKAAGGMVPVAILSATQFDACKLNPASLSLTFGSVRVFATADASSCHAADANGDGLPDMVCGFRVDTSLAEPGTSLGVLQGETSDGIAIRGEKAINIVP